jgi:uncharacterized DUF497 family protein
MKITYDPHKNIKNTKNRKMSFDLVYDFDFEATMLWQDVRKEYPETRYVALGYRVERLYFLCFSPP